MVDIIRGTTITGDSSITTGKEVLERQKVLEIDKRIFLLEPNKTPITAILSKIGKKVVNNPQFFVLSDKLLPTMQAIANSYLAPTLTLNPASGEYGDANVFNQYDIIRNASTGEMAMVTAVDISAQELTLTPVPSTGSFSANAGDIIEIVNNAKPEGSKQLVDSITAKITEDYNYTQIFETVIEVSGTLDSTALYGGKERDRQRRKKAIEHAIKIERAFLWGVREVVQSGSSIIRKTGGILKHYLNIDSPNGKTVVDNGGAALTSDKIEEWIYYMTRYGNHNKVVFASGRAMMALSSLFQNLSYIRVDQKGNYGKGGLVVTDWIIPNGQIKLIYHWLFDMIFFANVSKPGDILLALDFANSGLAYCALNGRDTKVYTDVQIDGKEDVKLDVIRTECGLQMSIPDVNGVLFNFSL